MKWSSLHIFYYGNIDKLLTKCILKLYKNKYIDNFFFIRYWNGGPHIRLRVAEKNYNQILEIKKRITDYLNCYPSTAQLSKEEYTLKSTKFSKKENIKPLPLQENNTILEIPYYPEMNKYIDEHTLFLSEMIFSISSVYALDILNITNKKGELYYISMQHTMYMLKYFIKDNTLLDKFLETYFKYWCSFSEIKSIKIPKISTLVEKDFSKYNSYFDILKQKHDYNELQGLLFNYIHLFNNRLGINTKEETFLAQCLLKYLKDGEY
ncbi:TPA: hypothetical protein PD805_002643 [Staphylococcus aureus]|nr:hypothetical protein [Staphylococcus aureus]HDE7973602.1 hypothetical protein [Staphylococcus aureus]HDE8177987.1 hypothetical protein [Staphylococcus aureus]HDE8718318.1 hypothetical protein [Staphylococcus aureus]HDE9051601.1 hypothetical protein [Staphylococcus aureus]